MQDSYHQQYPHFRFGREATSQQKPVCSTHALVSSLKSLFLLGGSWVVISGVVSPLIWVITIVTLLITPLITTHEPLSALLDFFLEV